MCVVKKIVKKSYFLSSIKSRFLNIFLCDLLNQSKCPKIPLNKYKMSLFFQQKKKKCLPGADQKESPQGGGGCKPGQK